MYKAALNRPIFDSNKHLDESSLFVNHLYCGDINVRKVGGGMDRMTVLKLPFGKHGHTIWEAREAHTLVFVIHCNTIRTISR